MCIIAVWSKSNVGNAYKTYDIHKRNLPTPSSSESKPNVSEEHQKRIREREELAQKAIERRQARVLEIRKAERAAEEVKKQRKKDDDEYAALVEDVLQELYQLSPEWLERKQKIMMVGCK